MICSYNKTSMTYTCCCVYSAGLLMMDRERLSETCEFHSKNKFEKLVHLICFVIRMIFYNHTQDSTRIQVQFCNGVTILYFNLGPQSFALSL